MSDDEFTHNFRRRRIPTIDSADEETEIENTDISEEKKCNDIEDQEKKRESIEYNDNIIRVHKNNYKSQNDSQTQVQLVDHDLYDSEGSDSDNDRIESDLSTVVTPDLFGDNEEIEPVIDELQNQTKQKINNSIKPKKKQHNKNALLEITRETQRLVREGSIRLPYHQPKPRSLTEFLERRKCLLPISLNASVDQLKQACQHLESLEKEVELFYTAPEVPNSKIKNNTEDTNDSNVNNTTQNNKSLSETPCSVIADETSYVNDFNYENVNEVKLNTITEVKDDNNQTDFVTSSSSINNTNKDACSLKDLIISEKIDNNEDVIIDERNYNQMMTNNKLERIETTSVTVSTKEVMAPCLMDSEKLNLSKEHENSCMIYEVNTKNNTDDDDEEYKALRGRYRKLIDMDRSADETVDYSVNCIDDTMTINNEDDAITNNSNRTAESINALKQMMKLLMTLDMEDELKESSIVKNNNINNNNRKPVNSVCRVRNILNNIKLPEIKLYDSETMIEFEYDAPTIISTKKPAGLISLMEKFVKHATLKPVSDKKKQSRQISILNTEKNDNNEIVNVSKEIVILDYEPDDLLSSTDRKRSKPGAKYSLLKTKLRKQVVEEKEANWSKYQKEKQLIYEPLENDEDGCNNKEIDDAKLEFTPAYLMDDLKDEDLEEDDVPLIDRDIIKSKYVDDEAEESDGEFDEDYEADDDSDGNEEDNDNYDIDDDGVDSQVEDKEKNCEDNDQSENQNEQQDRNDCSEIIENVESSDKVSVHEEKLFSIFNLKKLPEKSEVATINKINEMFQRNTTGTELENKAMGLDDIYTQPQDNFTESQLMGICSASFSMQKLPSENINYSFDSLDDESFSLNEKPDDDRISTDVQEETEKIQTNSPFTRENLNSDESDMDELFQKKKKRAKIFILSDDENENSTDIIDNDVNNEQQNDDEKSTNDESEQEEEEIDDEGTIENEEVFYDSEEEVVTEKARQFFENEAELSESEWASEDENEKDLDEFEKELGDEDEIDADKVKEELGKMHMRQILDDDQKDIRLLKEMLLEDGELHSGSKRHRKFQWKNLVNGDEFVSASFYDSDGENHPDDDDQEETEEHWRKLRHERDMFLSQREESDNETDETKDDYHDDSQLLKQGKRVLSSVSHNRISIPTEVVKGTTAVLSPNAKQPHKPKCGSFLSRGELMLSRLALTLGEGKASVNGPKNSRNFLFSSVSPVKDKHNIDDHDGNVDDDGTPEKVKKRKNVTVPSVNVKKIKLSTETGNNNAIRIPNVVNQRKSLLHMLVNDI